MINKKGSGFTDAQKIFDINTPLQSNVHMLKRNINCILLIFLFVLCTPKSFSDLSKGKTNHSAEMEVVIKKLLNTWKIPGISICEIANGEILWNSAIGIKDVNSREPLNEQTIFQAASLSKPVFAYAVLKICNEGLLDLDKPLVSYAQAGLIEKTFLGHSIDSPGFKKEWFKKITARMCLSHSSGLQHFGLKNPVEILFEPGARFYYSSNGIEYLRHIIEHIMNSTIDRIISKYVFNPLNMKLSSYIWRDAFKSNSAPGHDQHGNTKGEMDRYEFPTAQASLYTNAREYGLFLSAVMKGEGLKKELYEEMIKPQIKVNPNVYWGLGFGIETGPDGSALWHWGDGGTHTSYFYCNLDKKTGFVYFTNSFYGISIVKTILELTSNAEHPALSFSVGDWSFRDDYLSIGRELHKALFTENVEETILRYRQIAGTHEQGLKFIKEYSIQYWAAEFLRLDQFRDAMDVLQLLIEAYYQEKIDKLNTLVSKFKNNPSNTMKLEFLKYIRDTIQNRYFFETGANLFWDIESLIARLEPVTLKDKDPFSYAGKFPPYQIETVKGQIFFSTGKGKFFQMIPLNDTTFILRDVDYFRVQVKKTGRKITAIKGIWKTGKTKIFKREGK